MNRKNAVPILIVNSLILIFALWVLASRYQKLSKKESLSETMQTPAYESTTPPESETGETLRNILFQFRSSKVKTVAIIGDFNDWTPGPLKKGANNTYTITLKLHPGRYLYNYLVDGRIVTDPNNRKPPALSPRGFKSSILELKEINNSRKN